MKNGMITTVLVTVLASLVLADAASAYYSPSMGRFLNRDPLNEGGAVLVRQRLVPGFIPRDSGIMLIESHSNPTLFGTNDRDDLHWYQTASNDCLNRIDVLGLSAASAAPSSGGTTQQVTMVYNPNNCRGWTFPSGAEIVDACSAIDAMPANLLGPGRRSCLKRRCYDKNRRGYVDCDPCKCKKLGASSTTEGMSIFFSRTVYLCVNHRDSCHAIDTVFHELAHSCRAGESEAGAIGKWFGERCRGPQAPPPSPRPRPVPY